MHAILPQDDPYYSKYKQDFHLLNLMLDCGMSESVGLEYGMPNKNRGNKNNKQQQ